MERDHTVRGVGGPVVESPLRETEAQSEVRRGRRAPGESRGADAVDSAPAARQAHGAIEGYRKKGKSPAQASCSQEVGAFPFHRSPGVSHVLQGGEPERQTRVKPAKNI